ncbi:MAG: CRISPR-associated endoribonuclease Cas6 [Candidatus Nitrosocaldus sp.]
MNDGTIARIMLRFTVDRDVLIPPFSSKISRSIIIKMIGEDNLIFTDDKYKPYTFSPVLVEGKPLIRSMEVDGDDVFNPTTNLKLYKGKEYSFLITTIGHYMVTSIINSTKEINLFDSIFSITSMEFTLTTFNNLMFNDDEFIMRLLTPALLQLPKKWGDRKRDGNFLFPVPSLLLWSPAQHWNRYAPDDLKIESCKRLAVYSNFSMLEMDYNLRPTTVIYNEVSRPKGITGWVRWHIDDFDKEMAIQLRRILAYTQYMGVGRSRSIGFGMVELIPKNMARDKLQ